MGDVIRFSKAVTGADLLEAFKSSPCEHLLVIGMSADGKIDFGYTPMEVSRVVGLLEVLKHVILTKSDSPK